jgi:hypothetical protein
MGELCVWGGLLESLFLLVVVPRCRTSWYSRVIHVYNTFFRGVLFTPVLM